MIVVGRNGDSGAGGQGACDEARKNAAGGLHGSTFGAGLRLEWRGPVLLSDFGPISRKPNVLDESRDFRHNFASMKNSHPPNASRKLPATVAQARARVASAETAVQTAKNEAREAKRKRKLAKEASRQAKKHLKRAKEALGDAKCALAEAEDKQAREGKRTTSVKKRTTTHKPAKTNAAKRASSSKSRARRTAARRPVPKPEPQTPAEPELDPTKIETTAQQSEPPPKEIGSA